MKFLITGLGNIGNEYAHTRHNIGFDVVAAFIQKHGGSFKQDRLAYVSEVKWKGRIFICICPTTFMNLSGKAFKYWMDKEKIGLENTLTVLDDLALPIHKLRIRGTGSDGGHNGLKSIQETVNSVAYAKLRFGIGNDFPKGMQSDFVLGKWTKAEEPIIKNKIEKSVEAIEIFATQGLNAAMNAVNNYAFD
ncbi:aminoacyl-tRNA hydrolase [Niabella ginsengisoli]|uniref:Peptidyl-tRNA hydrolase n=1 Tax=Niabella ginsengisoli TaxID=522298 RepID=A0ABS9SFP7_9BACT|nr:aminoacyl-tRNA hydrolase [Niabella ginsengisoli]MCH5597170.1 aminoacyl-tRNA hydrolase [Niabella ginsengisoli]